MEFDLEKNCLDEAVVKKYRERLDDFGKKNQLNSLERLKKIFLEKQSFILSGLCTNTFKIVRAKCKEHY